MASELVFDEAKLSGEHGEIYLFQWLCEAEKSLAQLSPDLLKSSQTQLETTLVKVTTSVSPFPPPGRPIRNVAARCLVLLYSRGETRTLFDTMQTFTRVISDFKVDKDAKVSAFYCIGELMGAFGSQIMSFMGEIATLSIKIFKATAHSVLLRYHALLALRKALSTAAKAVSDVLAKDIIKQAKAALTDRAFAVERAASDVLLEMHTSLNHLRNPSDIESVMSLCAKSLDTADQITRRHLARLVGQILASTQLEREPQPAEPSKKGKKESGDDEEDIKPGASNDTPKTTMTPAEMFSHLSSIFNRPSSTRKTRIGVFDFYTSLLTTLGTSFVETNYSIIVRHLLTDIATHPRSATTRYEVLLVRKLVGVLLRDLMGVRMLSEQGQIGAIRELSTAYLKKWPALMPGQIAPNPLVLVIALKEISGLLQQLGNAPPPVQDALLDPMVTLLSHPNHSTRIAAAWCLRTFSYTTPRRLPKIVITVMEQLQRDITALSTPGAPADANKRALGHAYGLASLFAVIPERPLYVSYDISAKVLDTAIQLLKRAGEHDVGIAGVEIEVAWTSISSLMSLGPNFVRAHLPQLLVLWRNALPKLTSKDTSSGTSRTSTEWMFLLHVRESALGAILSFLKHNSPILVTLDVARRLSSLLANALSFANAFVDQNSEDLRDQPLTPSSGLSVSKREALLRRRVYQCFSALGFSSITESTQLILMQSVISLFASAEGYVGSGVQASIATSAGSFTTIWQAADGYGYGVTSLDVTSTDTLERRDRLNRDSIETSVDQLMSKPVLGSCEHDSHVLWGPRSSEGDQSWPEPPPPATGVVDSAIELFAHILPLQDAVACHRMIAQLIESVRSPKLERNPARKAAVFINATSALLLSLRLTATRFRQAQQTLGSPQCAAALADFLKDAILDGDEELRSVGSEALGRLASLAGTSFLTGQIKFLVDQVVSNRDPAARAGCALTFGAIYSQVGGLAAGPLLKTTVNVLMSLGNDPHPVVHFWSLSALAQVINAASLSYSPFITSTLGMLFKLYMMDTHDPDGGSPTNSNLRGDMPAYHVICQIIDALIGVLGPELQESARTRTLVLDLVQEFASEVDEGIRVEAIKCIQHFLIFGGEFLEVPDLVRRFRGYLSSSRRPLKMASINALYTLVQRDAFTMSKVGGDRLVEDLFGMLDDDPTIDGVRNVITSWLQQTVVHNPSAWIDLCQRIMSRTTASQQASDAANKAGALQDDEAESLSFAIVGSQSNQSRNGHLTSRWRTQLFALQCLHTICNMVGRSGHREHLDLPYARREGFQLSTLLVSRVPDLIKMAFTASAAYVTEIRLEGLVVLRDVIEIFSKSPDSEYEDALLLEQHQAPITAALTPAFSADSPPEILASAVEACAVFVGCGVVKEVGRMGRILKLLTSALEQSKESGMLSIGDAGELSPNASVMLRIATLTAWAELKVASVRQSYLNAVIQPYRSTLASLWIASLRDYASVRADSEVLQDSTSATMDLPYSGLGREVLLPYYEESWMKMLRAVATTMRENDPNILAAMDGSETASSANGAKDAQTSREEPTAYFFVIFGLVYDALVASSADATSTPTSRQTAITALETLTSIVRPEYSGKALFGPSIFDEFCGLCYRLAMTESPVVQLHLVQAMASIAKHQKLSLLLGPALANGQTEDSFPSDAPLTHCLRICAYVLRSAVPSSKTSLTKSSPSNPPETVALLMGAFQAFSFVGESFGPKYQESVRSVAISLYTELLKDEFSEIDLAGPTLPALKLLLQSPSPGSNAKYDRLVHGLFSACLQHVEEMRGRQGTAALAKVKNNLLASVLVMTVIPPNVKLSRAAVEYCCYLISQKLTDPDESSEIQLTAAHCAKTLIVAASTSPTLYSCIGLLIPGVITYLANVAAASASSDGVPSQGVDEVLKALAAFFGTVAEEKRPRVLGVILPVLMLLLSATPPNPSSPAKPPQTHTLAITYILNFATSAPQAFKDATSKLDAKGRETLEAAVRQAVGGMSGSTSTNSGSKPQISLRTF